MQLWIIIQQLIKLSMEPFQICQMITVTHHPHSHVNIGKCSWRQTKVVCSFASTSNLHGFSSADGTRDEITLKLLELDAFQLRNKKQKCNTDVLIFSFSCLKACAWYFEKETFNSTVKHYMRELSIFVLIMRYTAFKSVSGKLVHCYDKNKQVSSFRGGWAKKNLKKKKKKKKCNCEIVIHSHWYVTTS